MLLRVGGCQGDEPACSEEITSVVWCVGARLRHPEIRSDQCLGAVDVALLDRDLDCLGIDGGNAAVHAKGLADRRYQEQRTEAAADLNGGEIVNQRRGYPQATFASDIDEARLATSESHRHIGKRRKCCEHQWRRGEPLPRTCVEVIDHLQVHRTWCLADAGVERGGVCNPIIAGAAQDRPRDAPPRTSKLRLNQSSRSAFSYTSRSLEERANGFI